MTGAEATALAETVAWSIDDRRRKLRRLIRSSKAPAVVNLADLVGRI